MAGKIQWGVIGSGGIARRRTIPEGIMSANNAELTAVFDVDTAVNAEVANEFGTTAVESLDALLAAGVDAVYIATPADQHYKQVLACTKAGKHVLCEKPLGMNVEEAEKMISTCQKAGVQLGTAFMMRFQSQHQAALKLIQEGKLGTCVYGRAQLSCWYPPMDGAWRQDPKQGGGGSLMDMGGHCIDLLEMFFEEVEKVACFIHNSVHEYESEDSATAILYFKNGALATVDAFFCIPDAASKNVLEIYGSKGSVLARGTIGQSQAGEMTAYLQEDQAGYDAQQSQRAGEGVKINPPAMNMYRTEIEEFSQAILEGRTSKLDATIGLRSQKILSACYTSAHTGQSVILH